MSDEKKLDEMLNATKDGIPDDGSDLLNAELKDALIKLATPFITAAGTTALVAGAFYVFELLTATNHKMSDITGDTDLKPTEDKVSISKVEASAKDTDAALAKDEVTGKDGDLSAMQTEAAASTGEATALESGAAAARTKAGAADIETKGLKMT